MNKSALFTEAHKIAKATVKSVGNYMVAFKLALIELHKPNKASVEKITFVKHFLVSGDDEIHSGYIDHNKNFYSSDDDTPENRAEAESALATLKNCTNCFNCTNCTNCHDCYFCKDCVNCINCDFCKNCHNCRNCGACEWCSNCFNCSASFSLCNRSGVKNDQVYGSFKDGIASISGFKMTIKESLDVISKPFREFNHNTGHEFRSSWSITKKTLGYVGNVALPIHWEVFFSEDGSEVNWSRPFVFDGDLREVGLID